MKIHFGLPSGDYNLILNKDDLDLLLSKGHLCVHIGRAEFTTSRACINEKGNGFDFLDRKAAYNDLRVHLDEPVADLEAGDWNVQFLDITLDESCGFERHRKEDGK